MILKAQLGVLTLMGIYQISTLVFQNHFSITNKMMNDNSSGGVENNSVSIRIFHPIKIIQIFIKVGKMAGTQGYK